MCGICDDILFACGRFVFFFFQAEDGIRDFCLSRGLEERGDGGVGDGVVGLLYREICFVVHRVDQLAARVALLRAFTDLGAAVEDELQNLVDRRSEISLEAVVPEFEGALSTRLDAGF